MNDESHSKTVRMYAPLEPCKHHVASSKIHLQFDQHKESIVSKKITILIKVCATIALCYAYMVYVMPTFTITTDTEKLASYIMPVFLVGFTLYQITHLFCKVELYEKGMVYHTLFSHKEYSYEGLYDIQMSYDEQFYLDGRRHGILWSLFAKRFYKYYLVTFTNAKGFKLLPRIFRNLDEKLTELQTNLIDVKIKGE